ncbi:KH domain-containing protein [Alkalihalobacillus sp. LMS39]|uniref:KH domain-containing protein n=1 Tax=Alkalihalobacillus sp. LMS39 TaxID=2924032 RepID=UPI001FB2FB51|nr:KH domain-containing protein [Alkalihalobacillus sp. LMS39]UOE92865.1 KH domain-containing protein [Alkalihalobacillus sp. LMS39]
MKELIEHIAKALVDHPQEVFVKEIEDEQGMIVQLSVHADDMGKVIGKQGRVAKAIRSVLHAAALKENKRVRLDIVE